MKVSVSQVIVFATPAFFLLIAIELAWGRHGAVLVHGERWRRITRRRC